jgi:hypothetical protein
MPDRNAADRNAADALRLLVDGAARLGVPLEPEPARAMLRLLDELERWNAAYNLTAIRDRRQMLTHHLLDSLAAQQARNAGRIDPDAMGFSQGVSEQDRELLRSLGYIR